MRRASRWLVAAMLAMPWAASAQGGDDSGRPRDSGQEVVVDPETGQVTVRPREEPPPPPQRERPSSRVEVDRDRVEVRTGVDAEAQAQAQAEAERERGKRTAVSAQAGVITYAGEAAGVTTPGAMYGVSISRDLIRGVNAEFGYLGASYRAQGASGGISENGGTALVKVGPEYGNVSPYALWGFELTHLDTYGDTGGVREATMLRLPMGAGVAYTLPSESPAEVTLGVRVAYLFTLDAGAFPGLAEPSAANQFLSALSIGGRF